MKIADSCNRRVGRPIPTELKLNSYANLRKVLSWVSNLRWKYDHAKQFGEAMLQAALKKHEGVLKLWPPKSFKLFVMYYKQGQNMARSWSSISYWESNGYKKNRC